MPAQFHEDGKSRQKMVKMAKDQSCQQWGVRDISNDEINNYETSSEHVQSDIPWNTVTLTIFLFKGNGKTFFLLIKCKYPLLLINMWIAKFFKEKNQERIFLGFILGNHAISFGWITKRNKIISHAGAKHERLQWNE